MADHPLLSRPGRLFGTDGVRGVANLELDPQFALDMGRAAGLTLREGPVLIGRDTRRSGEMLSSAIQAGFHSAGIDTIDVGVLPSGGISHLTAETSAEMGVVISASHNPAPDNGIKLLSKFGTKLTDAQEDKIEVRMRKPNSKRVPYGAGVGTRFIKADALDSYVAALAKDADYSFQGTEVVFGCGNGRATRLESSRAAHRRSSRSARPNWELTSSGRGSTTNCPCCATWLNSSTCPSTKRATSATT